MNTDDYNSQYSLLQLEHTLIEREAHSQLNFNQKRFYVKLNLRMSENETVVLFYQHKKLIYLKLYSSSFYL